MKNKAPAAEQAAAAAAASTGAAEPATEPAGKPKAKAPHRMETREARKNRINMSNTKVKEGTYTEESVPMNPFV